MAAEHIERIGRRIRERRLELGLKQRELAERLPGKSDGNQVSKWERGEHRPGDDTLEQIAKALDCDVSYFLAPPPAEGTPDLMGELEERLTMDRLAAIEGQLARANEKLDELLAREVEREIEEAVEPEEQGGDASEEGFAES